MFKRLTSPERVQTFLEELPWRDSEHYRCPLSVLNGAGACCFEGALVAAAAFWYHGTPPFLVHLVAGADDDDHILAVYRKGAFWGACAKSNFSGLRGRVPVFRSVRELALSYFPEYYDRRARYTLRAFTMPLDLRNVRSVPWLTSDDAVNRISDTLDARPQIRLVTEARARGLALVDERSYKAGILGGRGLADFTFYSNKRPSAHRAK